jgi:mannose/fructose/N-acetylgalactosamine-specific phosphotransferase system component IIC
MRACAWLCIGAGILSAVAAFIITAHMPAANPWPSLVAGFCLAAVWIVVMAICWGAIGGSASMMCSEVTSSRALLWCL